MQSKSSEGEINVLAIQKQGHTYLFLYRDGLASDVLRALGRAAADPETNFSWYDAAVLGQKVRADQTSHSEVPNSSKSRF